MKTNLTNDNQAQAKRTAKDSVFRDLFENPKYLLLNCTRK